MNTELKYNIPVLPSQDIEIRELRESDCKIISEAYAAQGWDKPVEQYLRYVREQVEGVRDVLVAYSDGEFTGYLTILWTSDYPHFRERSIPEVSDFSVLQKFQRRGIGTKLMDAAEEQIMQRSGVAGIRVGLTEDYGKAQKLYVKRGYVPDGNGITQNGKPLRWGDSLIIDDDLSLNFIKRLK